jgi:hypothetical protein
MNVGHVMNYLNRKKGIVVFFALMRQCHVPRSKKIKNAVSKSQHFLFLGILSRVPSY